MPNKHKWYDVILAWANGEDIQVKSKLVGTLWGDVAEGYTPSFDNPSCEWRIKPKTITKKYRMALILKEDGTQTVEVFDVTNSGFPVPFIRWIGDTVEVEIEIESNA